MIMNMQFDQRFFRKHQRIILAVASTPGLGWVFGLNRLPQRAKHAIQDFGIYKITDSAIHWRKPDGSYEAACFTRPRFAEALAYSLSPLAHMAPQPGSRHLVFSPMGALGLLLAICQPALSMLAMGTTDTIYTGSGDGRIEASGTWATIHAAATGTAYNGGTGGFDCASMVAYIDRLYFPTDTSSIDDLAVVSAASFFVYGDDGAGVDTDTTSAELVQTSQASTSTLVDADYDNLTFASGGTKTFASWNGAGYNEIALDATGRSWISLSGYTMLGMITGRDLSNTVPTGNNWVSVSYSEKTGSSKDPYMSITYTIPSTGTGGLAALL